MSLFRKFACVLLFFLLMIFGTLSESFAKHSINSISQLNDDAFTIAASETGAYIEAVKKDLPKAKILNLSGQSKWEKPTLLPSTGGKWK